MAKVVSLQKKPNRSLTDQAYQELKSWILTGKFPIGTHYLEPEIAQLLGISRTPTREALIRLSQEGLIDIKPRRGVWVKPISLHDIKEIYEILTSLESTAVYLAAKRNLEKTDIDKLKEAVDEMDRALDQDDLDRWAEADVQFHMELVELGGNSRICTLVQTYFDQAHRVRMLTLRLRPKPTTSNKDHRAVVEAIQAGEAKNARWLHYKHREESGAMLLELLKSFGFTQM